MPTRTRMWMVAAIIFSLPSGCSIKPTIASIAIWKSTPLHFTVTNKTGSSIRLMDRWQGGHLDLVPGASETIPFVATVWEYRNENGSLVGRTRTIEFPSRLLEPEGDYWSMEVSIADGAPQLHRIELFDAWYTSHAPTRGLTIDITGPPEPGLPANR